MDMIRYLAGYIQSPVKKEEDEQKGGDEMV